jgi:hypothetical protein
VVRAIVPPTVSPGTQRVRVCLHAGNTVHEVEGLVRRIGEWVTLMQQRTGAEEERLGIVMQGKWAEQGEKARL